MSSWVAELVRALAGKLNEILTQNKKGTGDIGGTLEYEALDSAGSTRVREKK